MSSLEAKRKQTKFLAFCLFIFSLSFFCIIIKGCAQMICCRDFDIFIKISCLCAFFCTLHENFRRHYAFTWICSYFVLNLSSFSRHTFSAFLSFCSYRSYQFIALTANLEYSKVFIYSFVRSLASSKCMNKL